jgi:hypothetical protein
MLFSLLINIDEISPATCFGPQGYICFWECLVFALCCLDGASSCFLAQLLCCCFSVLAVAGRLLFKGLREALQAWKAPRCQVLRASVVKCCSSPVGCRLALLSVAVGSRRFLLLCVMLLFVWVGCFFWWALLLCADLLLCRWAGLDFLFFQVFV